jgi:hypothetical protein
MRIYYFGELVEDTNNPDSNKTKTEQTSLKLESSVEQKKQNKVKMGMDSIGDLLKDLNLNIDVYRPNSFKNPNNKGGYSRA